MMNDTFLGTGWGFPIELADHAPSIKLTSEEKNIQQSIWIILGTAQGERQMRPDFGCGIHDRLFGLNQQDTLGQLNADVRDALVRWEPRIDVLAVRTAPDSEDPTRLNINVSYQIRNSNSRFNLVYPFYLER